MDEIKKPKRQDLTLKQQAFIKYYIETKNATAAAKLAGYSAKSANDYIGLLLNNPKIQNAISKYKSKIDQSIIVTFNDKVNILMDLINRLTISDNDIYADEIIKAVGELNKMQGHYADIKSVNVNVNATGTIEDIRNARLEYKRDK